MDGVLKFVIGCICTAFFIITAVVVLEEKPEVVPGPSFPVVDLTEPLKRSSAPDPLGSQIEPASSGITWNNPSLPPLDAPQVKIPRPTLHMALSQDGRLIITGEIDLRPLLDAWCGEE